MKMIFKPILRALAATSMLTAAAPTAWANDPALTQRVLEIGDKLSGAFPRLHAVNGTPDFKEGGPRTHVKKVADKLKALMVERGVVSSNVDTQARLDALARRQAEVVVRNVDLQGRLHATLPFKVGQMPLCYVYSYGGTPENWRAIAGQAHDFERLVGSVGIAAHEVLHCVPQLLGLPTGTPDEFGRDPVAEQINDLAVAMVFHDVGGEVVGQAVLDFWQKFRTRTAEKLGYAQVTVDTPERWEQVKALVQERPVAWDVHDFAALIMQRFRDAYTVVHEQFAAVSPLGDRTSPALKFVFDEIGLPEMRTGNNAIGLVMVHSCEGVLRQRFAGDPAKLALIDEGLVALRELVNVIRQGAGLPLLEEGQYPEIAWDQSP